MGKMLINNFDNDIEVNDTTIGLRLLLVKCYDNKIKGLVTLPLFHFALLTQLRVANPQKKYNQQLKKGH